MLKRTTGDGTLREHLRIILFVITLSLILIPASVQAQGSAALVYSPCLHCPGCFSFCPQGDPDPAGLECPVCEEGAGRINIPRTGQTACYNSNGSIIDCSGTGQDGHIQAGIAWPVPRFTDNGNGTLTDNLTGLTWLQDANCISTQYPDFDNDGSFGYQWGDGLVSWQHAFDFVAGINNGDYPDCGGGRNDWRLPNVNEIESLMNTGVYQPLVWLTGQGFQNLQTNYYWSSTTSDYRSHQVWMLDFYSGNPYRTIGDKYADRHYPVWPVSGTTSFPAQVPKTGQVKCYGSADPWGEIPCAGTGQDGELQAGAPWPLPRFIENSDGTVTDNLTGLMWLKDANCFGSTTWQNELDTIADFNANPGDYNCSHYTASYNDWRMSNINEQESLFNAATSNHASWLSGSGLLFENLQTNYYWSSTSRVLPSSSAVWAFDMIAGTVAPASKNLSYLDLWPVRTAPPKFILTITKEGTGTGTVASLNPAGIDCGATCEAIYDEGTAVQLQAIPDTGYGFAGWSGDPDCEDGIVTMDRHKTCTATFSLETHTITITKDGTGIGTVLINGPGGVLVCGNECEAAYPSGTGIFLDVFLDAGSDFTGWGGDPDCGDAHVVLDADKTCTATFTLIQQSHLLIVGKAGDGSGTVVSINDPGIDCGADCSELYPVGTVITLEAAADPWNEFSGWGGDADCDDGIVTIGDEDIVCSAVFSIQTYTLTLNKSGSGSGVVQTGEPGGIRCGLNCTSADKTYNGGTEVTLVAGTDLPWIFTGWGGDPDCEDEIVTMDADKTCTAEFIDIADLQFDAFLMLKNESETPVQIRFERGIPRFIHMRVPIPAALQDDSVAAAFDFFIRYKELLTDTTPREHPLRQYYLKRIVTDSVAAVGGGTPDPNDIGQHLFFGQHIDGIPVYAASLALHMKNGKFTGYNGNYLAELPELPAPSVTPLSAEGIALANAPGSDLTVTGITRLIYYNRGLTAVGGGSPDPSSKTHLVWRVMVRGLRSADGIGTSWMYFVDAHDGAVLKGLDLSPEHNNPPKDFEIYTARRSTSDWCWNWPDDGNIDQWFSEAGPTGQYPGGDTDGDNAFTFAHQVYDFFHDTFDRHSYDNDGEEVEDMIHVGRNWRNAQHDPFCDHFLFGDGYTVYDVMAHEYTHGIDENKDGDGLIYENQSGALDESYADFFGAMADGNWRIGEDIRVNDEDGNAGSDEGDGEPESGNQCGNNEDDDGDEVQDEGCPETGAQCLDGDDDDGDGFIDEGCPGSCQDGIDNGGGGALDGDDTNCILRDMSDPTRKGDPDHINNYLDTDEDNGGVHTNSSIMNKAAYLITEGGTHSGIDVVGLGRGKTRPLWYDVLVRRLHENADFMDAREQTIAQAWDYVFDNLEQGLDYRYGFETEDICSIVNGFAAIGIGSADRDCDFVPDDPDDLDDDGDGVPDGDDNCHNHPNPGQGNIDGDMFGDACDTDKDDDGYNNGVDNCPNRANPDQTDTHLPDDGIGDVCDDNEACSDGSSGDGKPWSEDNCRNFCNADQLDTDNDDIGDVCDNDDDNDGVPDAWPDNCPTMANNDQADSDDDGIGDVCDNCPGDANSNQSNLDADVDGDACDDDDDGDGVDDPDDVCPMDPDPEQLVFNGIGLNCYPDIENILTGPDGFRGLIAFNDPALAASIPFFPCVGDVCPDWLPENFQTVVFMRMPHDMAVRIVDDRGFVVSKGGLGTLQSDASGMQWVEKSLDFHPSADSFFIPPAALSTGEIGQDPGNISLNQTGSDPPFRGRRYFLQILPAGGVTGGQAYPFEIRVESRLLNMEDRDSDGYIADADCNDTDATIHPDAPEACDGIDNDCDGITDEGVPLDDGNVCTEDLCDEGLGIYHLLVDPDDGNACTEDRCLPELGIFHSIIDPDDGIACTEDICDPQTGVQHIPISEAEVCDGTDNNCDGLVDEGVTETWYRDADNDGYSNGFRTESCDKPEGYKKIGELTDISGDCDDSNENVNPGKVEGPSGDPTCSDTVDNDCDGSTDITDQDCKIVFQNNPPSKPILIFPVNGAKNLPTALTLKWDKSTDLDGDKIILKLYIGEAADFTGVNPVTMTSVSNSSFNYAMLIGSPLYSLIILFGIVGIAGLSGKRRRIGLFIIIVIMTGVVLDSCGSGGRTEDNPLPEEGGVYKIENLKPNTTYYWKVVAEDGKGGSADSDIYSFTTGE